MRNFVILLLVVCLVCFAQCKDRKLAKKANAEVTEEKEAVKQITPQAQIKQSESPQKEADKKQAPVAQNVEKNEAPQKEADKQQAPVAQGKQVSEAPEADKQEAPVAQSDKKLCEAPQNKEEAPVQQDKNGEAPEGDKPKVQEEETSQKDKSVEKSKNKEADKLQSSDASGDASENGEKDEAENDASGSASGEDIEKRKKVKPEREMDTGCKCEGLMCECCIDVPLLGEGCADVKALKDSKTLKASLVWKGKEVKSIEKKLKDPTKFCVNVKKVEACVIIKDISLDKEKFGGCIGMTLKGKVLFKKFDINKELGCFHTKVKDALQQRDDDVPIRLRHGRWLQSKHKIAKPQ